MKANQLEAKQLHDGPFLTVLWDTPMRFIGIRWKPSTAKMTDEDQGHPDAFRRSGRRDGRSRNPG
jgi:hypothetical protein